MTHNQTFLKPLFFDFKSETTSWTISDGTDSFSVTFLKINGKPSFICTNLIDNYNYADLTLSLENQFSYYSYDKEAVANIESLKDYICFNNVYSECFYDYSFSKKNKYKNILDYAKQHYDSEKFLIIQFCYLYQISLNDDLTNPTRSEPFYHLKAIPNIYLHDKEFYLKNIDINMEELTIIEINLGKLESISKMRFELFSKKFPEKNSKDKTNKI